MTERILKDAKSLLDGRDISGILNNIALGIDMGTEDVSVFGDDTIRNLATIRGHSLTQSGFWDADADKDFFDNIDQFTAGALFSATGMTGALGDIVYFAEVNVSGVTPGANHGEVFKFSLDMVPRTDLFRGTLMENQAVTVTGDGTIRELVAVAAGQRLVGQIHVVAASGSSPTLDVLIQSDDLVGFGTPLTRLTFPQFTAVGANQQILAGPVTDTFYRATFTVGGGSPSFTVFISLAIQ